MKEQLQKLIQEKSIIKGNFILSTGNHTDFFFDLKPVMFDPFGISLIADMVLNNISSNFNAIGGLETGAIPLATAVSLRSISQPKYISSFFVRKKTKGHGSNKLIEGYLTSDMNILIIEDVTTTGNSILQVANILRSEGLPVHKAITIVDRLAGASDHLALNSIELLAIFNKNDFII